MDGQYLHMENTTIQKKYQSLKITPYINPTQNMDL